MNEHFNGPVLNPDLLDTDSAFAISGGNISKSVFYNNDARSYIRTVETDYGSHDFIAEMTFTLTELPGGNFTIQYFGLGSGVPDGAYFDESSGAYFRIHGPDIAGGRVDTGVRVHGTGGVFTNQTQGIGHISTSGGAHRAQIVKTGNILDFAIDVDFNGLFTADMTSQIDLTTVSSIDSTNGRIYFGTASAIDVFDDLLIISPSGDEDSDTVINSADQCRYTPSEEAPNSAGCSPSQLDDDNDGVNNAIDLCPATPVDASVDANGCNQAQLDDDDDNVVNASDQCPGTAANASVDVNGCSPSQLDDDNDSVNNAIDVCPNTPAGDTVDGVGCTVVLDDDDGDGIENAADDCPITPTNETANSAGCSPSQLDDDFDGVNNALDQCASTPVRTHVDAAGCSLDDDGDGILNEVDVGDYDASDAQYNGNVDLTFEKTGSTNSFACFIAHGGPATAEVFETDYASAVRSCRGRIHKVSDETPNVTTSQLGSRGIRLWITKGVDDGNANDRVQVRCDSPLCMREWNGKLYPTTYSMGDFYYIHDGPVSTKCVCDYHMVISANSSEVTVEEGETEVSIGEGDNIITFTVAAGPNGATGILILDNDDDGNLIAVNESEPGAPPITYAINGVEIGSLNPGDPPFSNTARSLKNLAIENLAPHEGESKKIAKAIKAIDKSLDRGWIDDSHLDRKDGKKVFDREKRAVKYLTKVVKDDSRGRGQVSEEGLTAVLAAIDLLVSADRALAQTALDQLVGIIAADPGRQGKVDRELAKGLEDLEKGDEELSKGKPHKAIDSYKKAWVRAVNGAKEAAKEPDPDDDDDDDDDDDNAADDDDDD